MQEKLVRAVAQEYVDRLAPLAHLIGAIAEIDESGRNVSQTEIRDIIDEAGVSNCTVFPVHSLISSLNPYDAGTITPPDMKFFHELVSGDVIPSMHRRVAQAVDGIVSGFTASPPSSAEARKRVLKNASETICMELARLKQLCQGTLPHPDLTGLWKSFSCDERLSVIHMG